MGLFDKVKKMFTEEEYEEVTEEVQVEQIKKEVTHVPIENPNVEQIEEVPEIKDNKSQKSPVFFSDHDFEDLAKPRHVETVNQKDAYFSKEELAKMYGSNMIKEKKEEPKPKTFKPTPIISPIYGILDKNYHKEDIVERQESKGVTKTRPTSNVEYVRNKAYGTLEEQLENEILYSKKENHGDNDLFEELTKEKSPLLFEDEVKPKKAPEEITMDLTKELDDLLQKNQQSIKQTSREEKNKNIDLEETNKEDLFNMIDSMYEGDEK